MDKLFLQRTKAVEKQTSTNTSIQLDITYTDINMFPIINLLALFSFSIQIHFTKLQVNVNLLKKLLWVWIISVLLFFLLSKKWALRFKKEVP